MSEFFQRLKELNPKADVIFEDGRVKIRGDITLPFKDRNIDIDVDDLTIVNEGDGIVTISAPEHVYLPPGETSGIRGNPNRKCFGL
ncbi:MAG TPA: hypothetical protein ENI23_14055 [bacterium]|nr:hypothetical protein [bacterium]